jgi:SAM-dependent methyltransferase
MEQIDHQVGSRFLFGWLKDNIRKRGVAGIGNFSVSYLTDFWFDLRYGTSTSGWIAPSDLDTDSPNQRHSVRYQATKQRPFMGLMRSLSFPPDSVFVDVGCGKGKVLLIASGFGFKKVVGLDFSRDLCVIARANVQTYQRRIRETLDIEIIETDILDYEIKTDQNVFYLYNPFDGVIMSKFIRRIGASIQKTPRKVWLIYHIPEQSEIIEAQSVFPKRTPHSIGGVEFIVYESE